jgi:hypothetical protein
VYAIKICKQPNAICIFALITLPMVCLQKAKPSLPSLYTTQRRVSYQSQQFIALMDSAFITGSEYLCEDKLFFPRSDFYSRFINKDIA